MTGKLSFTDDNMEEGDPDPEQEDHLLQTVLTCKGDLADPEFPSRLKQLTSKLENILHTDVRVSKVEPWNSVRVTFNIPRDAALRLKHLAERGDNKLQELGVLSVQIEGDTIVALTIAGRDNQPQEIVLKTTDGGAASGGGGGGGGGGFAQTDDASAPGPSNVDITQKSISQLFAQHSPVGHTASNLFNQIAASGVFRSPNVVAPNSEPLPFQQASPRNAVIGQRRPAVHAFPFSSMQTHPVSSSQSATSPGLATMGNPMLQQQQQPRGFAPGQVYPPPRPPGLPTQTSISYTSVPRMVASSEVALSSPLLVNLLQSGGGGGGADAHNKLLSPTANAEGTPKKKRKPRKSKEKPGERLKPAPLSIARTSPQPQDPPPPGMRHIINPFTGQLEPVANDDSESSPGPADHPETANDFSFSSPEHVKPGKAGSDVDEEAEARVRVPAADDDDDNVKKSNSEDSERLDAVGVIASEDANDLTASSAEWQPGSPKLKLVKSESKSPPLAPTVLKITSTRDNQGNPTFTVRTRTRDSKTKDDKLIKCSVKVDTKRSSDDEPKLPPIKIKIPKSSIASLEQSITSVSPSRRKCKDRSRGSSSERSPGIGRSKDTLLSSDDHDKPITVTRMEDITEPGEPQAAECGITSTTIVIGVEPPKMDEVPVSRLSADANSSLLSSSSSSSVSATAVAVADEKPEISVSRTVLAADGACSAAMPARVSAPAATDEEAVCTANHLSGSASDMSVASRGATHEAAVTNTSAQNNEMHGGKTTARHADTIDRTAATAEPHPGVNNAAAATPGVAPANRQLQKTEGGGPAAAAAADDVSAETKPVDELLKMKTSELLAADSCRDSGKGTSPESERDKSPENSDKGKSPNSLKDPSEWEGLEDYLDECSKSPSSLGGGGGASNTYKFSYGGGGGQYAVTAAPPGGTNSSSHVRTTSSYDADTLAGGATLLGATSDHRGGGGGDVCSTLASVYGARAYGVDAPPRPHVKLKSGQAAAGGVYKHDVKQVLQQQQHGKVNMKAAAAAAAAMVDGGGGAREVTANIAAVGEAAMRSLYAPCSASGALVPIQGYGGGGGGGGGKSFAVQEVYARGAPSPAALQHGKSLVAAMPLSAQPARTTHSPVDPATAAGAIIHATKLGGVSYPLQQWSGGGAVSLDGLHNAQQQQGAPAPAASSAQPGLACSQPDAATVSANSVFAASVSSSSSASMNGPSSSAAALSVTEVVSSILNAYSVSMQAAAGSAPQTTCASLSRDHMSRQHYQSSPTTATTATKNASYGVAAAAIDGGNAPTLKNGAAHQQTLAQGALASHQPRTSSTHSPVVASNLANTIAEVSRGVVAAGDKAGVCSLATATSLTSTSPQQQQRVSSGVTTATTTTRVRPSPPKPAPLQIPKVQTSGPTLVASPVNLASSYLLAAASLTQSVQASMSLASSHLFGPLSPPLPSLQSSAAGSQCLTTTSQVGVGSYTMRSSKAVQKRSISPGRGSSPRAWSNAAAQPASPSLAAVTADACSIAAAAAVREQPACTWTTTPTAAAVSNGPASPAYSLPTSITTALSALSETSMALSRCHGRAVAPPTSSSQSNSAPITNVFLSQFATSEMSHDSADAKSPASDGYHSATKPQSASPRQRDDDSTPVARKLESESHAVSASQFNFEEVSVSALVMNSDDVHDYAPLPAPGENSPSPKQEPAVTKTIVIDIPVSTSSVPMAPASAGKRASRQQPSPPSMRITRSAAVVSPKPAVVDAAQQGALASHAGTPTATPRASPRGVKRKCGSEEPENGVAGAGARVGGRLRRRGSVDSQPEPVSPRETFTRPSEPDEANAASKKLSKRKSSETAAELIKACIGLEEKPARPSPTAGEDTRGGKPLPPPPLPRGRPGDDARPDSPKPAARPTRSRRRGNAETTENESSDDEVLLSELVGRKPGDRRGGKSPQERPLRGKEIQSNSRNNKDARGMRTRTHSESSAASETGDRLGKTGKEEKVGKKEVPKAVEKNTRAASRRRCSPSPMPPVAQEQKEQVAEKNTNKRATRSSGTKVESSQDLPPVKRNRRR
ncbi:PREDICTED: serine-rich adhesin for platelets-like [Priapulus caudatus]|uniref:Serine-rich adhesin for platelets-like n=1 Tax=Priapulus caudatus TaxID=37621 RepID=A0ABM1DRI3_PRICU|nr:PREDICTED: serine-rich adhesin for platelets-like [Priapulus caudatus]